MFTFCYSSLCFKISHAYYIGSGWVATLAHINPKTAVAVVFPTQVVYTELFELLGNGNRFEFELILESAITDHPGRTVGS